VRVHLDTETSAVPVPLLLLSVYMSGTHHEPLIQTLMADYTDAMLHQLLELHAKKLQRSLPPICPTQMGHSDGTQTHHL